MLISLLTASMIAQAASSAAPAKPDEAVVARGKYLIEIMNCNDCHTQGWYEAPDKVPVTKWLTGSPEVGDKGDWGVSYAKNVRHWLQKKTEADWIKFAREGKPKPPMPIEGLRRTTDEDLKAIYAFIRSLGDDATVVPKNLKPGEKVTTPYFDHSFHKP